MQLLRATEIAIQRGLYAPEDLCLIASLTPEARTFCESDELWHALSMWTHIRPLPASHTAFFVSDASASCRVTLLARYRPAFSVRQRVRKLWRRAHAVWQALAPGHLSALRPGLSEEELKSVERGMPAETELPEDFAESLRCHDGQWEELGDWQFADLCSDRPGFRVLHLLPMSKAMGELAYARSRSVATSHWLPLARAHGADSHFLDEGPWRLLHVGDEMTCAHGHGRMCYGEVYNGSSAMDGLSRAASCFADYLENYVMLLEGVQEQAANEDWIDPQETLLSLFASDEVHCEAQDNWVTTTLGKGKGRNWRWVGGKRPLRVLKAPICKGGRTPARCKGQGRSL